MPSPAFHAKSAIPEKCHNYFSSPVSQCQTNTKKLNRIFIFRAFLRHVHFTSSKREQKRYTSRDCHFSRSCLDEKIAQARMCTATSRKTIHSTCLTFFRCFSTHGVLLAKVLFKPFQASPDGSWIAFCEPSHLKGLHEVKRAVLWRTNSTQTSQCLFCDSIFCRSLSPLQPSKFSSEPILLCSKFFNHPHTSALRWCRSKMKFRSATTIQVSMHAATHFSPRVWGKTCTRGVQREGFACGKK